MCPPKPTVIWPLEAGKKKEADAMTFARSTLADALIDARRRGTLAAFTARMAPASIAEAMGVQKAVTEAIGASVAGWKVGYAPEGVPVAAPLYAGVIHRGGEVLDVGPSGKSGIEVEIALLLGKDLPPRPGRPYGRAELLDACEALLAAVEIVETRLPDPPKPPYLALLADNISHGSFVRGDDVKTFHKLALERLNCRLRLDGRVIHEGVGGHAMGDPLVPVIDYANHPCDLLGGLRAGQIVTTGTLSGCPFIEGAGKIQAEIEGLGEVRFEIKG
jgi:2-keto-4-pentenoate hydratase